MKAWFLARTQSEQLSLAVLAVVVLCYALLMGVLAPLADARDNAVQQNARALEVKQRVNTMVAEIEALRGKDSSTGPKTTLMNLINQASQAEGLPIARLQPSSNGELQVRFEGVMFNDVAQFLHTLEIEQGVIVREVNLSQSDVGMVAATIRLAQGG